MFKDNTAFVTGGTGSIGSAAHEIDYLVPHVTSIPRVVERVRENSLIHG